VEEVVGSVIAVMVGRGWTHNEQQAGKKDQSQTEMNL
jgi:hypothetical protein